MVDIHCHICPGLDDGSGTIGESLAMLEIAEENGTDIIIATPHCNIPAQPENGEREKSRIQSFDMLVEASQDNYSNVELYRGGEIFGTPDAPSKVKMGLIPTMCGTNYVLTEFAFTIPERPAVEILRDFLRLGYIPIVAHPERYAFVLNDISAATRLISMGAILQVNKGSLFGKFGAYEERAAHYLVGNRLASLVASDAHSPYMRTPELSSAFEMICEVYSPDYAELLLEINPRRIIENKIIELR